MNIEKTLDNLHSKVTRIKLLQIFTAFTRILLGIGFIYPSIPKIRHLPFTSLPDSNPVGHYFNALLQTGYYYEFIGWSQLIASVLLLIPRTAHLGALMFFPIILNITVLTNAVGFQGTWLITILMLLACTYLVAWDYDRLKPIFFGKRTRKSDFFAYEYVWLPLFFVISAICGLSFFSFIGISNLDRSPKVNYLIFSLVGLAFGTLVMLHHRFMDVGELKNNQKKYNDIILQKSNN